MDASESANKAPESGDWTIEGIRVDEVLAGFSEVGNILSGAYNEISTRGMFRADTVFWLGRAIENIDRLVEGIESERPR